MRQVLLLERRHWIAAAAALLVGGGGTGDNLNNTNNNALASAQDRLTLPQAVRLITERCPLEFRRAVQETGRFLYRGEAVTTSPVILCPTPDLLEAATYSDHHHHDDDDDNSRGDALRFFTCLEKRYSAASSPVLPSHGHVGTACKPEAALWGSPCSVWPLVEAAATSSSSSPDGSPRVVTGEQHSNSRPLFGYMWPSSTSLFYPGSTCTDDFVVNHGLAQALAHEKEVLFCTSSFLVVPETYDDQLRLLLGVM
jgi:hypothetical protein